MIDAILIGMIMTQLDINNACSLSRNEAIGSTSLESLSCNMQTLDNFVNSTNETINNRVGNSITTISGYSSQIQAVLADAGGVPLGDGQYNVGDIYTQRNQYLIDNGVAYKVRSTVTLPYTTTEANAINDSNLAPFDEVSNVHLTTAIEQSIGEGARLYIGDSGNVNSVAENGDTVPANTTHLRITISGRPSIVSINPVPTSSGVIAGLTASGCTIGGTTTTFRSLPTTTHANVRDYGAVGDGVTSDSAAFQMAFDSGLPVFVPPTSQYYLVGGVTAPQGLILFGSRNYRYTAAAVSDMVGSNGIVYDTTQSFFIDWQVNTVIQDLSFHGNDRSTDFTRNATTRIRMFRVSVFGFNNGFGRNSGIGNSRLLECHFSGNNDGIRGLTDSHVYMCEINANESDGIVITAGNNDTQYIGNKIEFNNEKGFNIFGGQSNNAIIGGIIDRNGHAGISITSDAGLIIDDVTLRRNGRFSESNEEQDAHIALRGGSTDRLIIGKIRTDVGEDDGGGGYNSPENVITASNLASVVGEISGADLRGGTTRVFRERSGGSLTIQRFIGNNVTHSANNVSTIDVLKGYGNTGFNFPGDVIFEDTTPSYTASTNVTITGLSAVPDFSHAYYDLDILSRNSVTGNAFMNRYIMAVTRGSSGASVSLLGVAATSQTVPGVTASANDDGTEVTLTLDPTTATLTSRIVVKENS